MPYKPTGRPQGRPRKSSPLAGVRPSLTEKQWIVARFLRKNPGATQTQAARAAKVTRQAVSKMWSNPHFKNGYLWLINEELANRYADKDAKKDRARRERDLEYLRISKFAFEYLQRFSWGKAKAENPDLSVRSPIDGKTYKDLDAYIEHLRANGAIPGGNYQDPGSREWKALERRFSELGPSSSEWERIRDLLQRGSPVSEGK